MIPETFKRWKLPITNAVIAMPRAKSLSMAAFMQRPLYQHAKHCAWACVDCTGLQPKKSQNCPLSFLGFRMILKDCPKRNYHSTRKSIFLPNCAICRRGCQADPSETRCLGLALAGREVQIGNQNDLSQKKVSQGFGRLGSRSKTGNRVKRQILARPSAGAPDDAKRPHSAIGSCLPTPGDHRRVGTQPIMTRFEAGPIQARLINQQL